MKKSYIIPVLFVLAAILRLWQIGAASFWYDEVFTATISKLPIGQMMTAIEGDVHPPLYYFLTWILVHMGFSSETALRLPSTAFSLASLYLLWALLKKRNAPLSVQIGAVGFMVLSSYQEYYSQEGRMYGLLQLEVLAMVWFVLDRRYVAFGLAATAALYTHSYGLFYLPIVGVIGVVHELKAPMIVPDPECIDEFYKQPPYRLVMPEEKSRLRQSVAAIGIPFLAWTPWLFVELHQMRDLQSGFWIQWVSPGTVIYSVYMQFFADTQPQAWRSISALVVCGALFFALIAAIRNRRYLLLWLGLAPLAAAILASLVWHPILLYRGLIGSAPFLYWLAAEELAPKQWSYRLVSLAIILPVVVTGLYGYYRYNPTNKGIELATIREIRAQWQPGDLVLNISDNSAVFWNYYAPDMRQVELPSCGLDLGSLSDQTRQAVGIHQSAYDQLPAHTRLWVIWGASATAVNCEDQQAAAITQGMVRVHYEDFFGIAFNAVYLGGSNGNR